jgi:polyisoprenoid-binding protein YceI
MKIRSGALFLAVVLLSAALAQGARAAQPSWVMDLSEADVTFSVQVLGIFAINGRFERLHGGLEFDESCQASNIRFSIDSASVSTRDTALNQVLRSPALLNTENFPTISFASNRITLHQGKHDLITGELDLNGISHEVSFVVLHDSDRPEHLTAGTTRLEATASISRKAFGITALPIAVADTIDITVTMNTRPDAITLADSRFQNNF